MKVKIKIVSYAFVAILIGFLFFFFYQTMVESEINKFKKSYSFFFSSDDESFLLLRGWRAKKEGETGFVTMNKERAIFIVSMPEKDAISLIFKYKVHNPNQEIKIYTQDQLVGTLKGLEPDVWVEQYVILDSDVVQEDLNKLELIKTEPSNPDFYKLTVTNYQNKNLTFLRAYVVWESTKWFRRRGSLSVNWQFCCWGAAFFVSLWLIYSIIFWLITKEKFTYILRLDFWTYFPAVAVFLVLFLISKIVSSYTFFYYKFDFLLILIGSISIGKIYQLIKYVRKDVVTLRLRQVCEWTIKKYNVYANAFIILFITLMLSSAILLMLKLNLAAEWVCNVAFFILIAGVLMKIISFFIEKHYLEE